MWRLGWKNLKQHYVTFKVLDSTPPPATLQRINGWMMEKESTVIHLSAESHIV